MNVPAKPAPAKPTSAPVPLLAFSPSTSTHRGSEPEQEPPAVLSYFVMRRATGYIALALPVVAVLVSYWHHGCIPSSISASYYTVVRNFFIGCLCAVGVFFITSIGYEDDRRYSIFGGAMAFLVAFFPTSPDTLCQLCMAETPFPASPKVHAVAAILLFLNLAWFCVLFCRSQAHPKSLIPKIAGLPRQKQKRNLVYIFCGSTMLIAMIYYAIVTYLNHHNHPEPHYAPLVVEWLCLWLFALAWLTKGQQLIKDPAHK